MKTVTIEIPDDCEVKVVKKEEIAKKFGCSGEQLKIVS